MKKAKEKDKSYKPFDREQCLEDLEVDIDNLVKQWAEQPTKYLGYGLELSFLIKKKNKMRQKLVHAIIKNPDEYGVTKLPVSDAAINRVLDIDDDLIDINYEIDNYTYAVKSFEQRKKALEYESQLLQGGFHGDPKERRGK